MTVYCLRDPFTQRVKYVGHTKNAKQREYAWKHGGYGWSTPMNKWLDQLRHNGHHPIFERLEENVDGDYGRYREAHWIKIFRQQSAARSAHYHIMAEYLLTLLKAAPIKKARR